MRKKLLESQFEKAQRCCVGFLLAFIALFYSSFGCASAPDVAQQFARAELVKRSDFVEFSKGLAVLEAQRAELPRAQQQHLNYLQAWRSTFEGKYDLAIAGFENVIKYSANPVLEFRATATIVNSLTLAKKYHEAFSYLDKLLELLPTVKDAEAREQARGIAAFLYIQVAQYELGLEQINLLMAEGKSSWAKCAGAQLKFEAQFKAKRVMNDGQEFTQVIEECVQSKEFIFVNLLRSYLAQHYIEQKKYELAVKLLLENRSDVQASHYPRLISAFDAALARAFLELGQLKQARFYALAAVKQGVQDAYTEPQVEAFKVLYLTAEREDDLRAALKYHRQYTAADKAHLDDISARQLAYQIVRQKTVAKQLQIESLSRQNQVLNLQQQLGDTAVENARLYLLLLGTVLGFIVFWAYKTKKSQMHFMKLAQHDALTEIYNRRHFLHLAKIAATNCQRAAQPASVVMMDLDHFKQVNDQLGHAAGDLVLKQATAICGGYLREHDIFGRVGGEEFGILLPNCDTSTAEHVAECMRQALHMLNLRFEEKCIQVSASFGVTSSSSSGYGLEKLMADADCALYAAKKQGRDRVADFAQVQVQQRGK